MWNKRSQRHCPIAFAWCSMGGRQGQFTTCHCSPHSLKRIIRLDTGKCFLAFSPLPDETAFGSNQISDWIVETLSIYNMTTENVVALVGDNTAVNPKTALLLKL